MATNAGVTLAIDAPALVTLEPYTSAEFRILLTADATLMTHSHAPTVDVVINGDLEMEHRPRFWLSEVSGYVKFDSQTIGQPDLRLPYYAALRPVSDMRAENELLDFTSSTSQDIALHGVHVDTNHESEMGIKSLVSAFELLYVNTQAPPQWGKEAWVRVIGAASNYPGKLAEYGNEEDALANTTVFFALATEGDWVTLHPWSVRFRFHVGAGAQPPFVVENDLLNVVAGRGSGNDIFLAYPGEPGFKNPVVFLMNPSMYLNHLPPNDYDTRPFLTNVIVFPVLASALNIADPENAKIHLLVESAVLDRDGDRPILGQWPDSGSWLIYDVTNPGLRFSGSSDVPGDSAPIFFDMDAASIEVTYNQTGYEGNGVLQEANPAAVSGSFGALLLHHHNVKGIRAEQLYVVTETETDTDNDGIPDVIETGFDSDNDRISNFLDLDSDGDGIPDATEGPGDADNDGISDYLDLDAEGDGIPDELETDDDWDDDGIPNYLDTDSDGDGVLDLYEREWDADGDLAPNFLDLDSDGDRIDDRDEI